MRKYCAVVCACHLSSGLDEAVPIFLAVIEVSNMVERDVPNYGLNSVLDIRTRMACLIYEMVRDGTGLILLQPGFQPRTGDNPALDSGFPTRIP